jgi:hypothetical protein
MKSTSKATTSIEVKLHCDVPFDLCFYFKSKRNIFFNETIFCHSIGGEYLDLNFVDSIVLMVDFDIEILFVMTFVL